MIVKAAAAGDVQIAARPLLSRLEMTHLIELGTIRVFGMRIGVHFVRAVVVVDERYLLTARDRDVLRADGVVRDRDGRRRGARRTAAGRRRRA